MPLGFALAAVIGGMVWNNPGMETCQACHGHGVIPPERECANENCRRLFRWQDGSRGAQRPHVNGVRYCSHRCAKAQSERDRRKKGAQRFPVRILGTDRMLTVAEVETIKAALAEPDADWAEVARRFGLIEPTDQA